MKWWRHGKFITVLSPYHAIKKKFVSSAHKQSHFRYHFYKIVEQAKTRLEHAFSVPVLETIKIREVGLFETKILVVEMKRSEVGVSWTRSICNNKIGFKFLFETKREKQALRFCSKQNEVE